MIKYIWGDIMKKTILFIISLSVLSCSSLNEYLRDRNVITYKDDVKYSVIEKKDREKIKEIIIEKPVIIEKEVIKEVEKPIIVEKPVIVEKIVEKEVIKEVKQVENTEKADRTANIVKADTKPTITSKISSNNSKKNEVVVEKVIKKEQKIENINFDSTDEKILDYIAEKVVENKDQIRKKTIESINKLKQKGISLTPKEFLAKAYENIKTTNVNSFILAAARVINNIEKNR